jgi:predicted alpha/beta-fold hydrolase
MMAQDDYNKNINSTNVRDRILKKKIFYLLLKGVWMVWPAIVDKLVLRLFFSPVEYKINQLEKSLLDRGRSFQIKIRNKIIQCWRWGEGPTIIFAHGWNGRGAQFQSLIDAIIKANYSVITYDAPGHGSSQGKTSNYFEFTETLRILWQSCKDENVVAVVGHSLGASALINFISKEQFNKDVILIAPALKLRELLFHTFEQHGIPKIVYQNLVQNLELYHGYNIFTDNPVQLIKNIKNDILIIHDKNDKAVPFEDSEHADELYDNINLHATDGLGHKRILNDKIIIETVVGYLEKRQDKNRMIQKAS